MTSPPPKWFKPQLTRLVAEAPAGEGRLPEIKCDGYRMHARIDGNEVKLLTRAGLDWSHRYRRTVEALRSLKVKSAYPDGELCALNTEGVPVFSRLQAAMDECRTKRCCRHPPPGSAWRSECKENNASAHGNVGIANQLATTSRYVRSVL